MATMSIRGLDDKALSRLKRRAKREGSSLNSLVVSLLQDDANAVRKPQPLQKFDDLNALAGTWSAQQVREFERDTAAFSEVDASLWK
jgi:hypothetical protein